MKRTTNVVVQSLPPANKRSSRSSDNHKDTFGKNTQRAGIPIPIWRHYKSRPVFMGVVQIVRNADWKDYSVLIKLDDPNGPLHGPGHVMTDDEFFTECSHYDRTTVTDYEYKAIPYVDFSSKPIFPDRYDASFDTKYPFHSVQPQIRAKDQVRVVVCGFVQGVAALERFWVSVVSVTTTGIVSGHSLSNLDCFDVQEMDWLSFPITCVLGVGHGENWNK